jgi:thiamine kinase-like enzyme
MELKNIFSRFKVKSSFLKAEPLKIGHINDTFLIYTQDENEKYILQRINRHIFKNVPELIHNIRTVTQHISHKIDSSHGDSLLREKLILIQTITGDYFYKDNSGDSWRMYNYIEGTSHSSINNPLKAYWAGKAFGKFQFLLSDLPAEKLFETIPDFHNMKTRYKTFLSSMEKNALKRVEEAKQEIEFVRKNIDEMIAMQELIDAGAIPVRITHNDTKINNILFDENDIPVCIVDLETVMPGSVLYDFGDAIRTATNTAAEDEGDLNRVTMEINLFEAYTKGYLETAKSFLIKAEIENLALAAKYITFIMGLRFLTDYLDGDKYYKINSSKHNLQRTKAQFKLVESMNQQFGEMKEIVAKYC